MGIRIKKIYEEVMTLAMLRLIVGVNSFLCPGCQIRALCLIQYDRLLMCTLYHYFFLGKKKMTFKLRIFHSLLLLPFDWWYLCHLKVLLIHLDLI